MMMPPVGIVGAGAWGTALALVTRRARREVLIWAHGSDVVAAINERHENPLLLPGVALDPAIRATGDMGELSACDTVLLAPPAQHLRATATLLAPHLADGAPVALCAKGVELDSLKLMTEVAAEILPARQIAVISGPTLAPEVARDLPTAVTVAAADETVGRTVIDAIGTKRFRPYLSDDPVGAEIGGAVKNVLAIACGIVAGRGLGDNARAALVTRGLAEMIRLAVAKGGKPETLMGLSGLGDLVLTCNAPTSRNMSLGVALGQGMPLAGILAKRRAVTEGVTSAAAIAALAIRLGVDMPIVAAVDRLLHRSADIDSEIAGLLARPFKAEAPPG
jgi:glycerol-3-phosphate dehydrogenase (NAD(P)+)